MRARIIGKSSAMRGRVTSPPFSLILCDYATAAIGSIRLGSLFLTLPLDKEIGARRCKPGKTMPCPRKQTDAHLLFELGYLFGDRRLRDLESIGSATEI
jgi:hypothetical protein